MHFTNIPDFGDIFDFANRWTRICFTTEKVRQYCFNKHFHIERARSFHLSEKSLLREICYNIYIPYHIPISFSFCNFDVYSLPWPPIAFNVTIIAPGFTHFLDWFKYVISIVSAVAIREISFSFHPQCKIADQVLFGANKRPLPRLLIFGNYSHPPDLIWTPRLLILENFCFNNCKIIRL